MPLNTNIVEIDQISERTGSQGIAVNNAMTVQAPTVDANPATKKYVDDNIPSTGNFLLNSNNLSDVSNVSTSRDSLGLGASDTPTFDNVRHTAAAGTAGPAILDLNGELIKSFFKQVEDLTQSQTNSTTFVEKLKLTTDSVEAGTYRIGLSYNWSHEVNDTNSRVRVQLDDTTDIFTMESEPQDAGLDQMLPRSGFAYVVLTSGVHEIDIDFATENGADTVYIRDARLEFWRIS